MKTTVAAEELTEARPTLPALGVRALSIQGLLLVSASVLLPAAAHAAGLPVRALLPMHWPVLLVGLCYGWRSGALVGLAAPVLSFLLSGMPVPAVLPAMTVELAAYGLVSGLLRERGWGAPISTALAVVAGRGIFLAAALATGATGGAMLAYLEAAMLPGLAAALGQVVLLPLLAGWWVARDGG